MRSETPWTCSHTLPWKNGTNPKTKSKLLNGDSESGHTTSLVVSLPRNPEPNIAHYHGADEEMFVLGGEFTFDGDKWFSESGYASYPRGCVHGANVHVRDGYHLLLRYDGQASLVRVEEPEEDHAYFPADVAADNEIIEIHSICTNQPRNLSQHRVRVRSSGEGSTLVEACFSEERTISLRCDSFLEIFIKEASDYRSEDLIVEDGFYRYQANSSSPIRFSGHGRLSLIVSHGDKLTVETLEDLHPD